MRWIDPHGAEITEFAGHTDDCGPCANEVALATVQRRSPSTAQMNAIRARDLAAGIFRSGGGQTVYELVADVHRFEPGVTVKLTPAQVDFDTPHYDTLHQALKDAMNRQNSSVINVGNAAALPGNESGVAWHFVTCVGVDDTLGYLICNGDEIPFDGQPNWVTWAQIEAAKPVAIVEYVKGILMGTMPTGYSDSDGQITTPTAGVVIRGGFRLEFLRDPGGFVARFGDPLSNEVAVPDVGDDGQHGPGVEQVFALGVWGYTATENCFVLWAGLMLTRARAQIATLRATAPPTTRATEAQAIIDSLIAYEKTYDS